MGADLYRAVFQLYEAGTYYLCIIFVIVLCLSRDVLWKYFSRTSLPQSYHIVQEMQALERSNNNGKPEKASARKICILYSYYVLLEWNEGKKKEESLTAGFV